MSDPNHFNEDDFKSTPQEDKERLETLPKKADGNFDLEAMSPEQKATFWEIRAKM